MSTLVVAEVTNSPLPPDLHKLNKSVIKQIKREGKLMLKIRISMHRPLTAETPEFYFLFMQILSDYPCNVVRYHNVRYGTVLYKVTNMSRGRISIGDKGFNRFNPSFYHKHTYCIVHYSICQVDFSYGTV